jgi:hypothetical protein
MILRIISDEEMIKNSIGKPVLNGKTYDNRYNIPKPIDSGLYDRSIFGSEKVGVCTCGLTRNTEKGTKVYCSACKDLVFADIDSYRNNYSYYKLAIPCMIIPKVTAFADYINQVLDYDLFSNQNERSAINDLWSYAYTTEEQSEYILNTRCGNGKLWVTNITENTRTDTIGLLGLMQLTGRMINGQRFDIDKYVSTIIPIISTYHRKMAETILGDHIRLDLDSNRKYVEGIQTIIEISDLINSNNLISQIHDPIEFSNLCYNYNWAVEVAVQQIELLDPSKEHLTRDLTRVGAKNSIYATISSCTECDMQHIMVPRDITYAALDNIIIKKIKELNSDVSAVSEYRKGASGNSEVAENAYQEVLKDSTCVFWRNPSLHKGSMRAMKPISWNNQTIGVPIEILKPMNADFDGDATALIFLFGEEGDRVFENMKSDNTWTYEKNNQPIYFPEHEMLFGLAIASKVVSKSSGKVPIYKNIEEADKDFDDNKIDYNELININDKTTTYGRHKISNIIHQDLDDLIGKDNTINSNNILDISMSVSNKKDRVTIIHNLNKFGSKIVTLEGMSTTFDDVYDLNDPKINKLLQDDSTNDEEKLINLNNYIKDQIVDNFYKKSSKGNISLAVQTGSRVKPDTLQSMYAPDIRLDENNKLIFNKDSSMFKGMSEEQFMYKGSENRLVQTFKKAGTPASGYIARQLISTLMRFRYHAVEGSTDKIGLLLPKEKAIGRTTLRGTIVSEKTPTDKDGRVRVKSNMFTNSYIVYKDELSPRFYNNANDNSAIGMTAATSMTENVSQSILGLKHGRGRLTKYDVTDIKAVNSGVINSITNKFVTVVTSDGKTDVYRITDIMSYDNNIKEGNNIKAGDTLIHAIREATLGDKVARQSLLLKVRLANSVYEANEMPADTTATLCYSPINGTIDYDKNGDLIINSLLKIKVTSNLIPLYPSGTEIKKGERLFSTLTCVLDLNLYHDMLKKYTSNTEEECDQDTFDMLLLGADEVGLSTVNPEGYELLYKMISKNKFNTHNTPKNTDSFFDRLYYEDKYAGIRSFVNKDNISNGYIPVGDSIILNLLTSG